MNMNTNFLNSRRAKFAAKYPELFEKLESATWFLELKIKELVNASRVELEKKLAPNGFTFSENTNECFKISFIGEDLSTVNVELRLSSHASPIALCDCEKGTQRIRCEHMILAYRTHLHLVSLGMAENLTVKSNCRWIHRWFQET